MARRSTGIPSHSLQEPRICVRESPEHRKSEGMQWPSFVSPSVVALTSNSPAAAKQTASGGPALSQSLLQIPEAPQSRSESPEGPVHLTRKDAFVRLPGLRTKGSDAVTQAVHRSEFWMKGVTTGQPLPEDKEIQSDSRGDSAQRRSTASQRSAAATSAMSTQSRHSQSSFTLLENVRQAPMWSPRAAITLDMLSGKQGALVPTPSKLRPGIVARIKPNNTAKAAIVSSPAGSPSVSRVSPYEVDTKPLERKSSRLAKPLSPLNTVSVLPQHKGKLTVHAVRMIAAGKTQSSELLSPNVPKESGCCGQGSHASVLLHRPLGGYQGLVETERGASAIGVQADSQCGV
jgi:hypothetical protein